MPKHQHYPTNANPLTHYRSPFRSRWFVRWIYPYLGPIRTHHMPAGEREMFITSPPIYLLPSYCHPHFFITPTYCPSCYYLSVHPPHACRCNVTPLHLLCLFLLLFLLFVTHIYQYRSIPTGRFKTCFPHSLSHQSNLLSFLIVCIYLLI